MISLYIILHLVHLRQHCTKPNEFKDIDGLKQSMKDQKRPVEHTTKIQGDEDVRRCRTQQ